MASGDGRAPARWQARQDRTIRTKTDRLSEKIDNSYVWKKSRNRGESAIKMKQSYKRLLEKRMTDQGRTDPICLHYGTSPPNSEEISGFIKALPLAVASSAALWGIGALLLFGVMGG
ncbi:hypothetical protein [Sphingobium sp.]|uniref:hypothetical protein n=1 Tax=Sphingobium sp. TaxID=1912891 RepID=UPI002614971E|nr:hypothetical protein [Sphingobium sp.]